MTEWRKYRTEVMVALDEFRRTVSPRTDSGTFDKSAYATMNEAEGKLVELIHEALDELAVLRHEYDCNRPGRR